MGLSILLIFSKIQLTSLILFTICLFIFHCFHLWFWLFLLMYSFGVLFILVVLELPTVSLLLMDIFSYPTNIHLFRCSNVIYVCICSVGMCTHALGATGELVLSFHWGFQRLNSGFQTCNAGAFYLVIHLWWLSLLFVR